MPNDHIPALPPRDERNRNALQPAAPHALGPALSHLTHLDSVSEDGLHFRDLWNIVLKRKWSVIAFFLIVVVLLRIL